MGGKKATAQKKDDGAKAAEAAARAQSALLRACKNDELRHAETAIRKGAHAGAQDEHGNAPLHVAAMYGALRVMLFLHSQGAELNVENKGKRTPLETARKVGEEGAIQLLEALAGGRFEEAQSMVNGQAASDDDDNDDETQMRDVTTDEVPLESKLTTAMHALDVSAPA
mmetsp:Transcript_7473/g.16478  ORF Transcript_7473/g.16478 Transcript_7473/m.16478 type:complete len:169 (-) Transcript_7473:316-822(-)